MGDWHAICQLPLPAGAKAVEECACISTRPYVCMPDSNTQLACAHQCSKPRQFKAHGSGGGERANCKLGIHLTQL